MQAWLKFSVSNWIYGEEPLEKTMKRLSRFGYNGIEIMGEPRLYERRYGIRRIRELLESHGLEVSSIAGMYPWPTEERDLANPKEEVRKRAVNYVKSCVDFAVELDAPLVIVVPSSVAKTRPLSNDVREEWRYSVESVRTAGEYAEERGVLLAVEPINRYETYLVNNVDQALKFVEEVGVKSVKVMLDTFHMNIEEDDPAAAIRKAGENLIHLHVADSNRKSVGRGHIDFKAIIRALKEIGYSRYLVMEPLPPLPDPYIAMRGTRSEELSDQYAQECIEILRYYMRVV